MTKRKCGVDFVYLLKVVERPDQNKRYNAPHSDSIEHSTKNGATSIAIQEMSAVRSSFGQENFHIFNKDCENTFNMSAENLTPTTPQN